MPRELKGFYFDLQRNRYFPVSSKPIQNLRQNKNDLSHHEASNSDQQNFDEEKATESIRKKKGMLHLLFQRELGMSDGFGNRRFKTETLQAHMTNSRSWSYGNLSTAFDSVVECFGDENDSFFYLISGGSKGSLGIWERVLLDGSRNPNDGSRQRVITAKQKQQQRQNYLEKQSQNSFGMSRRRGYEYGSYPSSLSCFSSNTFSNHFPMGHLQNESFSRKEEEEETPVSGSRLAFRSAKIQNMNVNHLSKITSIHPFLADSGEKMIMTSTFGDDNNPPSFLHLIKEKQRPHSNSNLNTHCECDLIKSMSFEMHDIWTSALSSDHEYAYVGTSNGSIMVNLESNQRLNIFNCNSALFCMQINSNGNTLMCGFRNGVISTVDLRCRNSFPIHNRINHTRKRNYSGSCYCSHSPIMQMQPSVCSMHLLKNDENYLIASSTHSGLSLWDRRNVRRSVLDYPGNVNTHHHFRLSVHPSQLFVLSGGEDRKVRIWDVFSGEILKTFGPYSSLPIATAWSNFQSGRSKDTDSKDSEASNLEWNFDRSSSAWIGLDDELIHLQI